MVGGFAGWVTISVASLCQGNCLWVSKPSQYYYIHQEAYSAPPYSLGIFNG